MAAPVLLVHTDVTSCEEQRPEANAYLRERKRSVWLYSYASETFKREAENMHFLVIETILEIFFFKPYEGSGYSLLLVRLNILSQNTS